MINTVTINPAIDRMLYLNKFEKNVTSRVLDTVDTIGGKGTHVSVNLKVLGEISNTFGICHGETGRIVIDMLEKEGLTVYYYHKNGQETRTNYLLIEESGDCTIVAQRGPILSMEDLNVLSQQMEEVIQPGDFLILSGDASNCPDPDIYNHMMRTFKGKNLKTFLDTSGASLTECIKESPYFIKPNLDELSALCGRTIPETDEDIIKAIDSLSPYQISVIAVSLGKNGSIVRTPDGIYRAYPPRVNVINTIGCGDCFLAGYAYGIYHHQSPQECIRLATAVSAATAESNSSVGFNLDRSRELMPLVTIEKIG